MFETYKYIILYVVYYIDNVVYFTFLAVNAFNHTFHSDIKEPNILNNVYTDGID